MAPSAITTITEDFSQYLSIAHDQNLHTNHGVGVNSSRELIGQAFKERVDSVDGDTCDVGDEDAFFIADMGAVYRQHLRWKLNLARVKPHYGELWDPSFEVSVTNIFQRSNATQIPKSSASSPPSAPASTARPKPRLSRSSSSASIPPASSTPSPARPNRTSATRPNTASSR